MSYSLDISKEYNAANKSVWTYSLIFSLTLTLTLIGDVLLVIFSNNDYLANYILSTLLTIIFGWWAIFFFTSIYKDINERYRYYKYIESGIKEESEVIFIEEIKDLTYVNGLYVYPIRVKYLLGISEEEKIIYTLEDKLDFNKGDKLSISTYQRILLKADKY